MTLHDPWVGGEHGLMENPLLRRMDPQRELQKLSQALTNVPLSVTLQGLCYVTPLPVKESCH